MQTEAGHTLPAKARMRRSRAHDGGANTVQNGNDELLT